MDIERLHDNVIDYKQSKIKEVICLSREEEGSPLFS